MFISSPAEQAAHTILRTLREHGHQAYLAGGCVRDYLLGLAAKDFDVATAATPAEITALFPRSLQVGAHFGVVVVPLEIAGETVATEVATFRHDGSYTDGRRPDAVRFSIDPREDVIRRDFTVNGMLLDPFATGTAHTILDFVGGRKDLAEHRLRTIGSPTQRFAEDKLRMLRAVRFAARLGFAIDPETAAAIRGHAAEIAQVSPERIRDELTRMLTEGHARRAFELLDQTGLLAEVLPEVTRLKGDSPAAAVPSRRRCLDPHTAAARKAARRCNRDARLGHAAARHRQTRHLPAAGPGQARRPHSLQRPHRSRRAHRGGDLRTPQVLERRHRADPLAHRQPHALRRHRRHEAVDFQTLSAPAAL